MSNFAAEPNVQLTQDINNQPISDIMQTHSRIQEIYIRILPRLTGYLTSRINDEETARDIAQNVFLELLESHVVFFSQAAEDAIVFRIARNMVNDYLRHHYVKREADSYFMQTCKTYTVDTESGILARDLSELELRTIAQLPPQRRRIYMLRRFEGLPSKKIAAMLGLSSRTVENHLLAGTHQVRDYVRACI